MPFKASARGSYGPQGQRVIKGPLAPVWVTTSLPGVSQNQAYSQQLNATDDSGDAPTYTLNSGSLPTGLSLSSSGLISGTASAAGTFTFTVNATDVNGRFTTSGSLSITVTSASVNYDLVRTTNGASGWGYGGGNTDAIAFNFDRAVKVRGLSIWNPVSGSYTLSGTCSVRIWQGTTVGSSEIANTSISGTSLPSSSPTAVFLPFSSPVQLQANTWYTMGLVWQSSQPGLTTNTTQGSPLTSGSFSAGGNTYNWSSQTPTFGGNPFANNGTSHNGSGQLPTIYLQT